MNALMLWTGFAAIIFTGLAGAAIHKKNSFTKLLAKTAREYRGMQKKASMAVDGIDNEKLLATLEKQELNEKIAHTKKLVDNITAKERLMKNLEPSSWLKRAKLVAYNNSDGDIFRLIKKKYSRWPKSEDMRLKIEREVAKANGKFSVSTLILKLEGMYGEIDRRECYDRITKWIESDTLCIELPKENGVRYFEIT